MEFRILGPLEVRQRDRLVQLGGARQRALLTMLLLNANRTVSSERLVEAFWGQDPPETHAKALQVRVSRLRKVLPPGMLHTRPPGYLIELEPDQLDLERFERLLAEGRQALAEGKPEAASASLRAALTLWRGPALAEFAAEPFARSESLRLEELRLGALEDRIEADLTLGRHAHLVGEVEALVASHPLRERLCGQLMLALYRSGRQAEALEAYREARRALVEELGLDPSPALQRLEKAILEQNLALEPPAGPKPARAASEPAPTPRVAKPPRVSLDTAAPGEERKLVTVLFADLVGSTELAGAQDPERTRALLERFYDAMAAEIDTVGGTVEKFVGDAVMAVFGAPAAQEDHAERALHAALAMRTRLEELFGDALALRIGVDTGEVVLGRAREGSSFVTGEAVNVAARLEQAAEPGEILVGERTAGAAGGAFQFREPVTVVAKGKPQGIVCQRLMRALSLARPRGVTGLRQAFVGRESELELLRATYRRAVREGEPHLVTIMGEAGVGKTGLIRELWVRLGAEAPDPLCRTGRCLPYGRGITYWPLGEVLKEHLGILENDSTETVRARLGDREILGLTLGLEAGSGLHPLVARERLHDAWVELLEEIVAARPLVLVVEDLHWAEQPLLDLIELVLREMRGPVLFLASARPELLDRRPGWGGGRRNSALLWLEPLSTDDAARMLDDLLAATVPARLREIVVERAEGNPFFLEELTGALIDQGLLERRESSWAFRELPAGFAVPDSVQAVLASRIDLLESAQKAALQAAAIIGRVFWPGPVRELLEGLEPDLAVLEERDFIRRRAGSSLAGEREFAFKHTVTREVAYTSLPKARRARLHATFAAWLERIGDGRDEHAPLLAHHYAEAVRPEDADLAWAEAGDELARLREKAVAWLRRAAELAAGRYALDEQIALLTGAVELESSDGGRAELWRSIARGNALKFDRTAFWDAMERAIELSADLSARAELLSELAFQTVYRWRHGEDRELIEGWIEQTLRLARPESAARARALIARSYCGPADADEFAHEASALAERLPDPELRAYAFHARQYGALVAGDYDEASRWAERRLELLRELGDPDQLADGYWSAIPAYAGRGRFDEARRIAQLHDEVTRDLTPHHRLHGVAALLEVEELASDWRRIRDLIDRTERAVAENTTPCVHNPRSLLVCALASAYLGDEDEAMRLESHADSLGEEEYGRAFEVRIRLSLLRNDLESVSRLLAQSEQPQKSLLRSIKLAPVAARLEALTALGDRVRLEAEAPPLLRPDTYLEPFALRALGVVRGDEKLIDQASARFDAMSLGWHVDQTHALL